MSTEPAGSPNPEPQTTSETGPTPASSTVVNELANLGKKLGVTIQSALSSQEFKDFEREVRDGFAMAVNEMNEAIAKARSTDVAKDVGGQAGKVVENVRSSKVTQDMRDGLIKGLKSLNRELDNVIDRFEPKPEAPEAPAAPEPPEAPQA